MISIQAHQACDNAFRQMKIAVRSQDPFNIDRCWLVSIMIIVYIKQIWNLINLLASYDTQYVIVLM